MKVPSVASYNSIDAQISSSLDVYQPGFDTIFKLPTSSRWTVSMSLSSNQQRNRKGQPLPMSIATETATFINNRFHLDFGDQCFVHIKTDINSGGQIPSNAKLCTDKSESPISGVRLVDEAACTQRGVHTLLCPSSRPYMCAQTTAFLVPVSVALPASILFYHVKEYSDVNNLPYQVTQLTSINAKDKTTHKMQVEFNVHKMQVVLTSQLVVGVKFVSESKTLFKQSSHVKPSPQQLRACSDNDNVCRISNSDPANDSDEPVFYFTQLRPTSTATRNEDS